MSTAELTPSVKQNAEAEAKKIAKEAALELRQKIRGEDGSYRVLQELGKGGNSAVYLVEAIDGPYRGVLFALKLFIKIEDDGRHERFNTEIEFLRKCDHPSIMRVFDSGKYPVRIDKKEYNFPFVIAEYLPKTLRTAMMGGLSIIEKAAFTLQLLAGLAYLASRSPDEIIHRDIKPENIFVKGRSAVLGDFGLLKAGDGVDPSIEFHIQASTGVRFPRNYPTPDLLEYCKQRTNPEPLSSKSDVFQLGLVIAELFTGAIPLAPRDKPFSPIILTDMGQIGGSQGEAIKSNIRKMLEMETAKRPSASELFDPWEGLFLELVDLSRQLEGQVFGG